MIPKPILYQPKDSKLWRRTKFIKNLITIIETRKATTVPVKSTIHSVKLRVKPSSTNALNTFKADAPSITGIARKKENSAAAVLETPTVEAPRIVEPERDVPGINESTWKQPILIAVT